MGSSAGGGIGGSSFKIGADTSNPMTNINAKAPKDTSGDPRFNPPEYQSFVNGGRLDGNYVYNPTLASTRGTGKQQVMYDNLYGRATGEGPSQSAKYLLDQQEMINSKATNDLRNDMNSATATGISNLAMHGGIDQAARERILNNSGTNYARAASDIFGQGEANRLGILANDENQKLGLLQGLYGNEMDTNRYNTGLENQGKMTNLANLIEEGRYGYNNRFNIWNTQMGAKGADEVANAQKAAANRKPGLLEDPVGYVTSTLGGLF